MRSLIHALLLALLVTSPTVLLNPAWAQREIRTEQVQFRPGTTSTFIEASIRGYEIVDYVLNARQGQYMNVSMATNNGANYFNILRPGEDQVAMFIGSSSGKQFEGILPESGDYKIRVYMMRSAARRNEVADYRLEMIISDIEGQSSGNSGNNYDATGDLPCSTGGGQPTRPCPFGVTRQGNGTAVVTITKPDGQTRRIFFENGRPTGSDGSGQLSVRKESDLNIISIGGERYEIVDAVIYGG